MSAQCEVIGRRAAETPLGFFERYLTIWVFICIVVGIVLGQTLPGVVQALGISAIAVPILIQVLFNSSLAYLLNRGLVRGGQAARHRMVGAWNPGK